MIYTTQDRYQLPRADEERSPEEEPVAPGQIAIKIINHLRAPIYYRRPMELTLQRLSGEGTWVDVGTTTEPIFTPTLPRVVKIEPDDEHFPHGVRVPEHPLSLEHWVARIEGPGTHRFRLDLYHDEALTERLPPADCVSNPFELVA